MEVLVMSQFDAEQYATYAHNEQSVIVSITSCGMNEAFIIPTKISGILDVLNLHFNDTDSKAEVDGGITEKDAFEICNFINKYKDTPILDRIIVHCEAGQSRSAGVAAAIMKYLNNDDSPIFNSNRYHPNMLCYRTVLNGFMR